MVRAFKRIDTKVGVQPAWVGCIRGSRLRFQCVPNPPCRLSMTTAQGSIAPGVGFGLYSLGFRVQEPRAKDGHYRGISCKRLRLETSEKKPKRPKLSAPSPKNKSPSTRN